MEEVVGGPDEQLRRVLWVEGGGEEGQAVR